MARMPKKSLKDMLDREVEKPVLEALYLEQGVALDQLRRAPEVLAAIAAAFNRLTSRDFEQGTLLRYMFNRRKSDGGDWPKLAGKAKKFQPVSDLFTPDQLEALKQIYLSMDVTSDEFLFRPKLMAEVARRFAAATGVSMSGSILVAAIVSKRKRAEWPKIRETEATAFSDIDEVAKRYGTGG